jgi:hypothetical protein
VVDDHVDRPGVEVRQRTKLTGTNRSFGLIALIYQCPSEKAGHVERPVRRAWCARGDRWTVNADRRRRRPAPHTPVVLCRPGGPCEGPKPDPIPNSAVKPFSAHGTKSQGLGESVAARPAKHNDAACKRSGQRFRHTRSSSPTTGTRGRFCARRYLW